MITVERSERYEARHGMRRGSGRREDWEKRRAKRGTGAQAKVQYHSPAISKHHKIITSILAQRQPRGGASAASEKFCRAKRGTQDKVQYHSPAISKHHEIITSILAQGQRRGGASAASEKFCDKLRSEDGVAKTSSFQDQSKSKPPRISPLSLFYSLRLVLYGGK